MLRSAAQRSVLLQLQRLADGMPGRLAAAGQAGNLLEQPAARLAGCQAVTPRWYSGAAGDAGEQQKGSWMPSWLKSKLPGVLGGTKEFGHIEELTLDSFATNLRQARQVGSVTRFVSGTSKISDPLAQGNLRMYETIIGAMSPAEKADLAKFDRAARQRVAAQAECTMAQVDDCIAKYQWMRDMVARMAQLRREGKPVPKTIDELERTLGTWHTRKQEAAPASSSAGAAAPPPAAGAPGVVPVSAMGPRGQPCPLAGKPAGRNTRCPLTRKAYKACCGRKPVG